MTSWSHSANSLRVIARVLFDDGTSGALNLDLVVNPEHKVYLLGGRSEVLRSAERGAQAAYLALRNRGLLRDTYQSFFTLEHGADRAVGVLGESAGLCFALAFAAHALAREHSQAQPISFAATGVLANGARRSRVDPVSGITAKVTAALTAVPAGALVFVPKANEGEVSEGVRAEAAAKGLRLVAVAHADQAVDELVAAMLGAGRRWRRWMPRMAWVAIAAMVFALGGMLVRGLAKQWALRVKVEVREGDFAALGRRSWNFLSIVNPRLGRLTATAVGDLELDIRLTALSDAENPEGPVALRPGDPYRLRVKPSRDCFLYAVQIDTWTSATVLFPNSRFSAAGNRIRRGREYWIPEGRRSLTLDANPGEETIFVVAAPWPARDIERLFARLSAATAETGSIVPEIRARFALRKGARAQGLRGIVYDEIVIAHR